MADQSPEHDEALDSHGLTVIQAVRACFQESNRAKQTRMHKNSFNRDMFLGNIDWSDKIEGQSTEHLPLIPQAMEQMTAFFQRALVQFGPWYTPSFAKDAPEIVTPDQARALLDIYLNDLPVAGGHQSTKFYKLLADSLKSGFLESLAIVKVHGQMVDEDAYVVEPGTPINLGDQVVNTPPRVGRRTKRNYRPRIDLVKDTDYYPDPTGRGLYEIHKVERDIHVIREAAERGIYDKEEVARLIVDQEREAEEQREKRQTGEDETTRPAFRKQVVVMEFWGTLLDSEGDVVHRDIVCAIANDTYLIRPPEPNPFWHGRSPFVAHPILRVPHSVWHRALYDEASSLNLAMDEMFNLILDGGMAQVWGIKQLRLSDLEDPSQASGGVAQGDTLVVKPTLPANAKVLEQVTEGQVPGDAMAVMALLRNEFTSASLTSELKLGSLPPKDVRATEIVEQSQSQAVTVDSIAADVEQDFIQPILEMAWMNLMQNASDLDSQQVVSAIGARTALALSRLTAAQRFVLYGPSANFRVTGLSHTLAKIRDFQKLMALLQAIQNNPLMLRAFFMKYDPEKVLAQMMRALNINPMDMERDDFSEQRLVREMQELTTFIQMIQGGPDQQGPSTQETGEPNLPSEINQLVNPTTGFTGNA